MTYNEFINNIINTRGRFACGDEYHERHHIIPRCCGGTDSDDNLIDLFAREHFEAHRLLAIENPTNHQLAYAFGCMAFVSREDIPRYKVSAEEYEEARKLFAKASSERQKGKILSEEHRLKIQQRVLENPPMLGKHHTAESKRKMKEHKPDQSGSKNPNYGNKWSDEQKASLSSKRIGSNNPKSFPIYCPELDETFWGAKEAQDKYGIQATGISACIHGRLKHAGKHPITGEKLSWVKVESN